MKYYILLLCTALLFLSGTTTSVSQESFTPDKKLLKTKTWTRVSNFRFEDDFLYVAVEWQENSYALLDMGFEDKELFRAKDFKEIKKEIKKLKKSRFKPILDLQNKDFWTRVSMYRFECEKLKLAVECLEKEFILLDMNSGKNELERSKDFREIQDKITALTIYHKL